MTPCFSGQDAEHAQDKRGQYQGYCDCCMQVIAFSSKAAVWCCSDPELLARLFNGSP